MILRTLKVLATQRNQPIMSGFKLEVGERHTRSIIPSKQSRRGSVLSLRTHECK